MRPLAFIPLLAAIVAPASVFPTTAPAGELSYPETRRVDQVDTYHGEAVADPYRWLENDVRTDKEVADWVAAQNSVTFAFLEAIPQREAIRDRLTALWNYERYSSPSKEGGRYYFFRNDGLQNQSVLYTMDSLDEEPRVLIDPNTWSDDGTVALAGTSCSDDGNYMAYGVSEAGSDWSHWRVKDLRTGTDMPERLKWIKFSYASWTLDGKGFFYSRYDEPEEGEAYQQSNLNQKIYYHRVGTPQADDVLVYERPDQPEWSFFPGVTEDGRYLVISVWKSGDNNLVYFRDLTEPYAAPRELIGGWDASYGFLGNDGPVFYFKTDLEAPNGRVVAVDTRKPDRPQWRTIVPEADEPLKGTGLIGGMITARYLHDASTRIRIYNMKGAHVRDVELPAIGTAYGFGGKRTETETFYTFTSFHTPPAIYRYDMITGESTLYRQADVDFEPGDYEVKQVFYASKDGTRVPMFITHRKGIALDGSHPLLLYGYGGFNASMTPGFSVSKLLWMEMGGVYAMACLRGGGEYGESWHEAGMKLNKQNVFDDFIAAAEWLVEHRYTRPEKLAIHGASNGGLLVGAVMTQRPDLFGACLPDVGVMDMLRYHKFTAGRYWTDDYGSSDNPDEYRALRAYSPYHNIREGTAYPPTLITTADTDDRVVPGHSFKFAAALQHAQKGDNPVLIRIETRAGHGGGMPTAKKIAETTDMFAFLAASLGMEGPKATK